MKKFVIHSVASAFILSALLSVKVMAQPSNQWTPQQTIPYYHPDTEPPYLVADRNRTVHAFSSQWVGTNEDDAVKAVVYNRWTLKEGWSVPVDILLSPIKEARIMDAFLDSFGTIHVIFVGGDETEAGLYYSRASAIRAANTQAWSRLLMIGEAAHDPSVAALAGDEQGNLVILYSGSQDGLGLYSLYSTDSGQTWTRPEPTFLTYDEIFPFVLKLSIGRSGLIHAVWDVRNEGGQGRQINYAYLDLGAQRWSRQVTLVAVDSGYGVLNPTVIEHQGEVFVAYSGITIVRSDDLGQTWSQPITPFRHTGVNGVMSFVEDSDETLHLLWAQRITGSPDIHGVWHSRWQGGIWTEPQAVVSGPLVRDQTGDRAFDPFDVHAVVSQGNVLLATWRSDPGLKGNGVWYSYRQLDAPELSITPLPTTAPPAPPTATVVVSGANVPPTPTPRPSLAEVFTEVPSGQQGSNYPAGPIVIALIPVVLLIAGVMAQSWWFGGRTGKH